MALIVIIFGAVSISAQANYMTIFGLELNKPFNVPECPIIQHKLLGGKDYDDYANSSDIKSMCFKRNLTPYVKKSFLKNSIKKPLPLLSTEQIDLVLPESRPIYAGREATAFIINGNFAGVNFSTPSFKTDNPTLLSDLVSDLTAKYGKPTKTTPQELQNDYGAKYTTYLYEWQLPDLSVIYSEYRGTVYIATPPLVQLRIENEKKNKTKNPL